MNETPRFRSLSIPRQRLVKLIQRLQFGQIELEIRDCEPDFSKPPRAVQKILIRSDCGNRSPGEKDDFQLKDDFVRLLRHLDHIGNGQISLVVQHGLPFMLFTEISEE